ncbi:MAG: hypothetical protein IPL19_30235 [Sandaracinaceae bacterium]|nr:hypothetical protein [Sandaracinaceae bacterium]MBK8412241.1 hypothetical protein [Sandaracinaceae bacterium]
MELRRSTPPRVEAWAELVAILKEHGPRWREPLAHLDDPKSPSPACTIGRGFIAGVRVRVDELAKHAAALAQHPIETLQLVGSLAARVPLAHVLAQPITRRVTALYLGDLQLTAEDYEALASCGSLDRCQAVVFGYRAIDDPHHDTLAPCPRLREKMLVLNSEVRHDALGGYWQSTRAAQ